MISINVRDLMHSFSKYLKIVKRGEKIILMERNVPVADIIPHNENVARPGWKRTIEKIEIKGESLSETVIRNRREQNK